MMKNPLDAYSTTQVMAASPGELTLMLYNGAIRFAKQAKQFMVEANVEQANYYLKKTSDIIYELIGTLKMEYDIAKQLWSLYDFMIHHMFIANLHKSSDKLQDVIGMLEELRDTWKQAIVLSNNITVKSVK